MSTQPLALDLEECAVSSNKVIDSLSPPSDMCTEIYSVKELGRLLAKESGLDSGKYDVVIEFKVGSLQLRDDKSPNAVPAMGVGFGGIALRPSSKDGPFTFEYKKRGKAKASKD